MQAQEDEDDQDDNDSDEDEEDEVEDDMGASDAEILDIVDDVDAQDEQTDGKIIIMGPWLSYLIMSQGNFYHSSYLLLTIKNTFIVLIAVTINYLPADLTPGL